ncbi:hypothetical protein SAMN05216196_108151 [Lutimaribacter pacificus]|uniref:Uncharacterized protein n=1 Tax=Lutimaribacter pacificus TaxID=391948 RepID=A0A1H0LVE5_9RHOB|nr:hypothetical protein [Lutimaribacter pacificus]SDO72083.1 hypothetical protein SAMN05216196_108151 [Lutimaribacter pacificus]SHK02832.1 hypothetical protein SAMN05444142_1036 [Lutimaribacter pacificus]
MFVGLTIVMPGLMYLNTIATGHICWPDMRLWMAPFLMLRWR